MRGIAAPQRPVIMARRLFGTSERHDHVDDQKADDRRHGEEMHVARALVAAEQRGQLLQLHRLPDREPDSTITTPARMTPR